MAKASNEQSTPLTSIFDAYRSANERLLLLDYDGTLVPFAARPEQAKPSAQTLGVITKLATDTHNTVIIISGRDQNVLDIWLGHLPVQFVAEHGAFEKRGGTWRSTSNLNPAWKEKVRPIMQSYVRTIPGSLLEEKQTALVYHYRDAANRVSARSAANTLLQKLRPLVTELDLHASHDNMTIEIRRSGTDKGQAALAGLALGNYDFVMCAGDSETDEDMFTELADLAFCIKIGSGKTAASYWIKSPEVFIDFLASLLEVHA